MKLPILPAVSRMAKSAAAKIASDRRFTAPKTSDFLADMERLGEDIAEEFKVTVIENIEENKYGFELSESTVRRKGSDTPLIDTHQLVDAIYREGTTVSVEDSPRDDSPLSNKELAIVHEYGVKDHNIPARPVWRNTFRDFEEVARERIEEFFDTHKFSKK